MSQAEAGLIKFFVKWGFIGFLILTGLNYLTDGKFSKSLKTETRSNVEAGDAKSKFENSIAVDPNEEADVVIGKNVSPEGDAGVSTAQSEETEITQQLDIASPNENIGEIPAATEDASKMPAEPLVDDPAAPSFTEGP
jgi:hypothetical protein